jgi:hypothetical protein
MLPFFVNRFPQVLASLALLLLLNNPSKAATLNAKCLLSINGTIWMNGKCSFKKVSTETDIASDEKILIVCPDGLPVDKSDCYGYQQRIVRPGVFTYLYHSGNLKGTLCWNGNKSRKADECFSGLIRDGACWSSSQARLMSRPQTPYSVRFCAWALQQ